MYEGPVIKFVQSVFAILGRVAPSTAGWLARLLLFRPQSFKRQRREQEWIERSTPLNLNCGLAAWSWGDPSAPPVLLVHGWSGRGTQMCAYIEPLLATGRRVIAIDGDAHGDSKGWRTNPLRFADKILEAGNELGPLDAVVGHSFGAATSTIAIFKGLQTDKMVYIAGPAAYRHVLDNAIDILNLPKRAVPHFIKQVERELGMNIAQMNVSGIVRNLATPCLVMHSLNDAEVPHTAGQEIAEAWPNAQFKSFDDLGHMRILWHRQSVETGVRFIAESDRDPARNISPISLPATAEDVRLPTS